MKGYFVGLLLSVLMGCSAYNSAKMPSVQNENKTVHNQNSNVPNKNVIVNNENSKALDCNNPNGYSFRVAENPNRKDDTDHLIPEDLNIVVSDEIKAKIELPIPDSEVKNFSLNSVEKTKEGVEIKVDWGGGKYYYEIQFNFRCKENQFYLYKVKNENSSTSNPDSGNFWDKTETKETKIEPNIAIEKFVMTDYLQ
jgi:hypothetical protein